jgi:hypothetical protein
MCVVDRATKAITYYEKFMNLYEKDGQAPEKLDVGAEEAYLLARFGAARLYVLCCEAAKGCNNFQLFLLSDPRNYYTATPKSLHNTWSTV